MREIDPDGFRQLWPVLFLQRTLPSSERANPELERLVVSRERERPDLTTAYRDGNLFALEHPALDWLRQCVHKTATDYCRRAGMNYPIDWSLHGWANVNRLGDYHDPHNHPHAYLSGTYYVRVPSRAPPAQPRRRAPGLHQLLRSARDQHDGPARRPAVRPEFTVAPAAGMILLWPAFLMHFVHPNLSEEPRVSVSFNLMVKDPERHLPREA